MCMIFTKIQQKLNQEIERDTHQFGNIANVWSTFGIKEKADGIFLEKGISSIQLYHDGNRWWILSWLSQSEKIAP